MSKKIHLRMCGVTADKNATIDGMFFFMDTIGLQPEIFHDAVQKWHCTPCLVDFIIQARRAGWNESKILSRLREYGSNIYPTESDKFASSLERAMKSPDLEQWHNNRRRRPNGQSK